MLALFSLLFNAVMFFELTLKYLDSQLGMVCVIFLSLLALTHFTPNRAQFARRDAIYYHSASVRQQDAIVITCTITSSPAAPTGPPSIPRQPVPRALLNSIGDLLDEYGRSLIFCVRF